jgi:ankyrin repeat protein
MIRAQHDKLSYRQFANWTALHWAASSGRSPCVRALIDSGATVNALSDNKQTALHVAALAGYVQVAEELVAAGVCIYTRTHVCMYVCT